MAKLIIAVRISLNEPSKLVDMSHYFSVKDHEKKVAEIKASIIETMAEEWSEFNDSVCPYREGYAPENCEKPDSKVMEGVTPILVESHTGYNMAFFVCVRDINDEFLSIFAV